MKYAPVDNMQFFVAHDVVRYSNQCSFVITQDTYKTSQNARSHRKVVVKKSTDKKTTFAYNRPIGAVPWSQAHDYRRNTNPRSAQTASSPRSCSSSPAAIPHRASS